MLYIHIIRITIFTGLVIGYASTVHAATFDCEGIKATFTEATFSGTVNGGFTQTSPDTLTVNAIPVAGLHTGGSLNFSDEDTVQAIGTLNGAWVNLSYAPANKETRLIINGTSYECKRLN